MLGEQPAGQGCHHVWQTPDRTYDGSWDEGWRDLWKTCSHALRQCKHTYTMNIWFCLRMHTYPCMQCMYVCMYVYITYVLHKCMYSYVHELIYIHNEWQACTCGAGEIQRERERKRESETDRGMGRPACKHVSPPEPTNYRTNAKLVKPYHGSAPPPPACAQRETQREKERRILGTERNLHQITVVCCGHHKGRPIEL